MICVANAQSVMQVAKIMANSFGLIIMEEQARVGTKANNQIQTWSGKVSI